MVWLPLLIPAGYIWGSIPWGLLIGRFATGVDVRNFGSGRTGTTNVLRTAGPKAALLVLIADLLKGALAVLAVRAAFNHHSLETATALAVLAGHNWSLFIKFHGGRGIAPGLGSLLAISPPAGLAAILVGLSAILFSRYVSIGSMLGATTGALAALGLGLAGLLPWTSAAFPLIGVPLVIYQHRDNIKRLLHGTERRLGKPSMPVRPLKAQESKE